LLTSSRSVPPIAATVVASESTDAWWVTSHSTAVAFPISLTRVSSRSTRRAAATTWKPSATRRRAVAAPIPLDAPVTTAIPVRPPRRRP
jgi:hypothetical protein